MFVVAITRWSRPDPAYRSGAPTPAPEEAVALAALLGQSPYDLKLALAGPLPIVLSRTAERGRAEGLLQALRERGHGAVACDASAVATGERLLVVRDFSFEEQALAVTTANGARATLPFTEIAVLVKATQESSAESTKETATRSLSLGRAALSGGLVTSKTTVQKTRDVASERELVLYVFRNSGEGHVLLRERSLRYTGLGAQLGRTMAENFAMTVGRLRQLAPAAPHDDRMVSQRRKASDVRVAGGSREQVVTASNAAEVDLAAHVLAVAHRQGQV